MTAGVSPLLEEIETAQCALTRVRRELEERGVDDTACELNSIQEHLVEISITLEEPEEPEEPQPEDYYITPTGYLGSQTALGVIEGHHIGVFCGAEEAVAHAKAKMDDEEFWPDIWHLSDHGNWLLLNASDYEEETG